jgi:hypothetical protein
MGIRQAFREIRKGIVVMWWGFFDWVAVVSWKALLLVSFLGLILGGGIFKLPTFTFLLIVASFIIKVVAGGKRRAERDANEATKRAETEQLERTVLEARMEALQAQIEPHFLFNTLGSIDQLIRPIRRAPPDAAEPDPLPALGHAARCAKAADLARSAESIFAAPSGNHGGANGRTPAVGGDGGLKSAVFPSMMLQTLVENAVKHGLEPKPEGGLLEIGAEVVDGQLAVHVRDTGIGFVPKAESGVGLANVRERLKALYNGRAELIISVPPAGGTCATIKVPYEIAPAQRQPDRLSARMRPCRPPPSLPTTKALMREKSSPA